MHGREGRAFERFYLRITRDGSREPSVDTPRGTDDRGRCVVITEPGQAMGQIQLQAKGSRHDPRSRTFEAQREDSVACAKLDLSASSVIH